MLKKILAALTLSFVFLMAIPSSAKAQDTNACWGVVSAQLAQSQVGALGDHSSTESTPRSGLGNVARLFFEMGLTTSPHISALGIFLATIDGVPETQCGG